VGLVSRPEAAATTALSTGVRAAVRSMEATAACHSQSSRRQPPSQPVMPATKKANELMAPHLQPTSTACRPRGPALFHRLRPLGADRNMAPMLFAKPSCQENDPGCSTGRMSGISPTSMTSLKRVALPRQACHAEEDSIRFSRIQPRPRCPTGCSTSATSKPVPLPQLIALWSSLGGESHSNNWEPMPAR